MMIWLPPPPPTQSCGERIAYDVEPAWSPDGSTIAFISGSDSADIGIYLIDTNGQNRRLAIHRPFASSPDWSPDGQWFVFSERGQIFKIKTNGDSATQLTAQGSNFFPSWSADGEWIAYDSNVESPNGMFGIWKMQFDGSNKIQIAYEPNIGEIRMPSWSPDVQKIVHQRYVIDAPEIVIMDSSGQNAIRLTFDNYFDSYPKYSPTGSQIIYTSQEQSGCLRIRVVNTDGSNKQVLTPNNQASMADWSPDGEYIVYTNVDSTNGRLWIMKKDGSEKRRLTF